MNWSGNMRNPLLKRLPRQLKEEVFKYFVIGALLISTIGLVSGFLVADNSMIKSYNESFEKYHIEDGHFIISSPLTQRQKINIEKHHVHLYEQNFYEEENYFYYFVCVVRYDNLFCTEGLYPRT